MKTTICKVGKQTLAGLVLASVMAFGTVQAEEDVIVCESLDGLTDCLELLTFASDEKGGRDRAGLGRKLTYAGDKFRQGKLCDAGLKVDEFNAKIYSLMIAPKEKITDSSPAGALRCALEGSRALADSLLSSCGSVEDPPRGKGPKNK